MKKFLLVGLIVFGLTAQADAAIFGGVKNKTVIVNKGVRVAPSHFVAPVVAPTCGYGCGGATLVAPLRIR